MDGPAPSGAPIRVVFCHYAADFGGGSDAALFNLVTHLPRARFSPAVILKTGDPLGDAYQKAGVDVVQLPLRSPRGNTFGYLLAYWPSVFRVAAAIRFLQADVVHVNTLYNIVAAVAARLAGRPLLWHVREILPGSRAVALLLQLQRVLATRAIAISNAVADTIRVGDARLRLVFDAVDLSAYDRLPEPSVVRRELNLPQNAPLVTTIGRLEPWKGQHVLVEAIPHVAAAHPNVRFLVVGACAVNKPDYESNLRARCKQLGIERHIIFTGRRSDIAALLAASSLLVLPTATPEPFGLTVVEAMAASCAVVATAAGGPLDTVLDGKTGWLIPPNDSRAMAERISQVLANPDMGRAMGEAGRKRAQALFSLPRHVDEMATVLEEAVRAKGKRKFH